MEYYCTCARKLKTSHEGIITRNQTSTVLVLPRAHDNLSASMKPEFEHLPRPRPWRCLFPTSSPRPLLNNAHALPSRARTCFAHLRRCSIAVGRCRRRPSRAVEPFRAPDGARPSFRRPSRSLPREVHARSRTRRSGCNETPRRIFPALPRQEVIRGPVTPHLPVVSVLAGFPTYQPAGASTQDSSEAVMVVLAKVPAGQGCSCAYRVPSVQ